MNSLVENFLSKVLSPLGGNFSSNPQTLVLSNGAIDLINRAYEGIPEGKVWDYHCHLVGTGKMGDAYIGPSFMKFSNLNYKVKFNVLMSSSGVDDIEKADEQYVSRLIQLLELMPGVGKVCLLALDQFYTFDGEPNKDLTKLYVSNDYMFEVYRRYPQYFEPCVSIHPYRFDALEELEKWAGLGVKMVKWLPNEMNIDPSSPVCEPFYHKLRMLDMVLLTHTGDETALTVPGLNHLGNPLLFRKPLEMGVKIIMAHCAGMGKGLDLDSKEKKIDHYYHYFLRLMKEPEYEKNLFGDISGLTLINRAGTSLNTILNKQDIHHRLVNGSDYPLPAVNAAVSTELLLQMKYITEREKKYLDEVYNFNPMLYDFVLKRTIRSPYNLDMRFSDSIFTKNALLGIDTLV
jgi:uncharacterized protein